MKTMENSNAVRVLSWLLGSVMALQMSPQTPPQPSDVMIVALSRDDSVLLGGISTGKDSQPGSIHVEIIAYLTPSGTWKSHPCNDSYSRQCQKFARDYLSKPHQYTVISADGRGARIRSSPVSLGECGEYDGIGTYGGPSIGGTGIAASSPEPFSAGDPAKRIAGAPAGPVRRALQALVPARLDSTDALRLYSLRLEGKDLIVVERAFQDYAFDPHDDTGQDHLKFIFVIGAMRNGRFELLYRKKNIEDENERVLGTIHMKNGRDFLVTAITDPEGHTFHVYGIRYGMVTLLYSGAGSSC